MQLLTLLGNQ